LDISAGRSAEWRTGWPLVVAAFCGFSFFSLMTVSMGAFIVPLARDFGWGRTLLSSGVALASLAAAVLSPFFGILIDRFGSRRVAMPGLVATMAAIALFGTVNGSPAQWLALWGVYAVISISVKTTVWTAAIAHHFSAARGMALAVTLSGTAAAQAIAPPLATWLIQDYGWRIAYVALGLGWGGLTFLICYVFLRDPRHSPLTDARPDLAQAASLPGLTIPAALRSRALWQINLASLIMMTLTIGLMVHQIPILTGAGLTSANAAWLAGLGGLAGIGGKLITGSLLDRLDPRLVGGITLGVTALAFALLIDGIRTDPAMIVAVVINGYGAGCALQIGSYLTAQHAGTKNFGAIYGGMTSVVAIGSGLGPVLAGAVFDQTGNYDIFLIGGTIGCVLSGALALLLPTIPTWSSMDADH
jgi:predicted MFS family arabinose efflux permease